MANYWRYSLTGINPATGKRKTEKSRIKFKSREKAEEQAKKTVKEFKQTYPTAIGSYKVFKA